MSVEEVLSDIRDRVVKMETTLNHMNKMRDEDKAQSKESDKALHSRIKRVEDKLFTVGWGLVLTAITVIISLIKTLWKGVG